MTRLIRRLVDKNSAAACALILLGFLVAGLSPFRAPHNGAGWLGIENGLRIRGDGVALSNRPFTVVGQTENGCSIELWLQPANNSGESTILTFYQPNPPKQFIVRQVGDSLLQLIKSDSSGTTLIDWEHTFFPGKRALITVASGTQGTTLYLDASAVKVEGYFHVLRKDCSGQLILGSAAISYNDWNGDVLGIAIYNSTLTDAQVLRHYEALNTLGRLNSNPTENAIALYTFSERSGSTVHNEIAGEPDLHIPPTFQIPGHPFMENPWNEIQSGGVDWKDVFINIAGFIPFGFFLLSYVLSTWQKNWAGLATVVLAALVSLMIEILQWYLPTRDSSMTDVIANVFGTALGILLYRLSFGSDTTVSHTGYKPSA